MENGLRSFGPYERFVRFQKGSPSAPTVLLYHGSCAHSAQFLPLLDALAAAGLTVATFDLLGCGLSPRPRAWDSYAPDALFAEALCFYEEYKNATTVLLGHSTGASLCAQIYQHARQSDADVVKGIVLLGAALEVPFSPPWVFYLPDFVLEWMQPAMTEQFLGAAFTEGADAELVEAERQASNKNEMHMCKAYYRQWEWRMPLANAAADAEEEMRSSKAATPLILVIQGKQDGVLPVQGAEALHAALQERFANVELVVVEGAAHQVMQEKSAEVIPHILALITACMKDGPS